MKFTINNKIISKFSVMISKILLKISSIISSQWFQKCSTLFKDLDRATLGEFYVEGTTESPDIGRGLENSLALQRSRDLATYKLKMNVVSNRRISSVFLCQIHAL